MGLHMFWEMFFNWIATTTFTDWITAGIAFIALLITAAIGAVSLIVADNTARSTAASVKEAHNNTQAQIANSLLEQYAAPQTLDAMNDLIEWRHRHPGQSYIDDFMLDRTVVVNQRPLDHSRRRLAHYFQRAAIVSRNNLVDRPLMQEVVSASQVRFARRYVEPLDRALSLQLRGHFNHRDYDTLAGLHDPHEPTWLNPDTPPSA